MNAIKPKRNLDITKYWFNKASKETIDEENVKMQQLMRKWSNNIEWFMYINFLQCTKVSPHSEMQHNLSKNEDCNYALKCIASELT